MPEELINEQLKRDYTDLTPETILSAVESMGYESSGRLLALNSYENRVYRCELEGGEAVINACDGDLYCGG